MNKKGVYEVLELFIYISFVIVVSLFIAIVAINYLNEKIDTTKLETFLLTRYLLNSDSCVAYKDELRVHQGNIDLNKVTFETLNHCFKKEGMGFKIEIQDGESTTIKSASNLNLRQEAYLPICKSIKGFICTKRKDMISYKDNETIKQGFMLTEVIFDEK